MLTVSQGAALSIQLASAACLGEVSGCLFAKGKPRRSSKGSYDENSAARLWQVSADLTGLTTAG